MRGHIGGKKDTPHQGVGFQEAEDHIIENTTESLQEERETDQEGSDSRESQGGPNEPTTPTMPESDQSNDQDELTPLPCGCDTIDESEYDAGIYRCVDCGDHFQIA